jgi:hypothetical protein
LVHQDLKDNGCDGCSCTALDKQCEAYLSFYSSAISCTSDRTNAGGTMLRDPAPSLCSDPIGKNAELAYGFNVQVKAGKNVCEASGDPKLSAPEWGNTRKRCSAELQPGGCVLGHCAPRPDAQEVCWPETEAGCGTLVTPQTFFQGYDDKRVCEACSCTATGGSCSDVGVIVTTDPTCKTGSVMRDDEKTCGALPSDARMRKAGKPTRPECSSQSAVSGTLVATGQVSLCCGGALLAP